MPRCSNCVHGHCPPKMSRRGFLVASGTAAMAAQLRVLDFASTLLADDVPKQDNGPLVCVGFALRKQGGRWWPSGTTEMLKDIRAQYEKILSDAAGELGVRLDIMPELMKDGTAYVERIKKTSPDGQILMALDFNQWKQVFKALENRGKIPTIIYANLSFHRGPTRVELERYAGEPGIYLGATSDVNWLKYALRMHKTLWRVKHKPIRILSCPGDGYDDAYKQVVASEEMRAIADADTIYLLSDGVPSGKSAGPEGILKIVGAANYLRGARIITLGFHPEGDGGFDEGFLRKLAGEHWGWYRRLNRDPRQKK